LDDGASCDLDRSTDQVNTSAHLFEIISELGGNYIPSIGSPAIDAGSNQHCPDTDQGGELRPQGAGCEIGADEVGADEVGEQDEEAVPLILEDVPAATDEPIITPSLTITPSDPPTDTPAPPTPTVTQPSLGGIIGNVWQDEDADGAWSRFTEVSIPNYQVRLGAGACSSTSYATELTDGAGVYFFEDLPPGTYCVRIDPDPTCSTCSTPTTATAFTANLSAGETESIRFGLRKTFCVD
jgi:hypothetical protein